MRLRGDAGEENKQKPGSGTRFSMTRQSARRTSARGFPAPAQYQDPARATGDNAQLN